MSLVVKKYVLVGCSEAFEYMDLCYVFASLKVDSPYSFIQKISSWYISVDRFLCHIRTLKVYLHKTNKPAVLRERKKLLLCHYKPV
jgi:hypothetical protein